MRLRLNALFAGSYIARSLTAALSSFISFSAAFFVLLVTREHYGTDFAITIGAVGSVFGLISVASAGFTVHTLMSTAQSFGRLRDQNGPTGPDQSTEVGRATADGPTSELHGLAAAEFRPALTMTLLVALVAVGLSFFGPGIFSVDGGYFYSYWWPYLAVLLLGPLTAVIAGLTQSAGQDGFGLWVSVVSTGLTVASAVLGILIGLEAHMALTLIGVTSLGVRLVALGMRVTRLSRFRIGIASALGTALRPDRGTWRWRDVSPIPAFLTTVDGFVFLLTYTIAISVAAHHSPADGAMIALVVSLMRALIVPIKQLGIVGGRMSRQGLLSPTEAGADGSRRADLRIVQFSASAVTTALGLLTFVLMVTEVIYITPLAIMLLVTAQVLAEPWSGILFSFLKVVSGPKVGVPALMGSYLLFGLLGLGAIAVLGTGDAVVVWAWMVTVRLIFLVLITRSARRWATQ